MAMICPLCGAATAFQPARSRQDAIDVNQSDEKKTVRREVIADAVISNSGLPDCYAICRCQNCGRLFVASQENYYDEYWQPVWPLPGAATVSEDIPENVRLAFKEAQKCLAVEAFGGCLLMCRTTIIRLQRDRDVSSLKELSNNGAISGMLYGQADEVRLWANMVGHDDFDEEGVTREAVSELVAYIEALLNAIYVEPARLASLKAARAQAESKEGESE